VVLNVKCVNLLTLVTSSPPNLKFSESGLGCGVENSTKEEFQAWEIGKEKSVTIWQHYPRAAALFWFTRLWFCKRRNGIVSLAGEYIPISKTCFRTTGTPLNIK
jgi:hypothetical protein